MRHSTIIVSVAILSLVFLTPTVWAKGSGCKKIGGNIDLTFTGIWEGSALLVIGDGLFTADVTFATESIKQTDDGNLVGTETGTFDFGLGDTFTELDKFTFGPSDENPAEFHFNGVGRITGGTGKFQDAFGKVVMQGFATFVGPPTVSLTLKGRICDIAE